ncbi:hypothetical protein C5S35_11060, partial [Candidatus Methanophagaceae archaeon]
IHKLKVKEEGGKLNIYVSSISKGVLEIKNFEIKEDLRTIFEKNPILSKIIHFLIFTIVVGVIIGVVANAVYDFVPSIRSPSPLYCKPSNLDPNSLTTEDGYINIWEPCTNSRAPKKGWLVLENPFYKLNINLDHSYYLIFDKKRNKDILVYDDTLKSGSTTLTGCDLGFGDNDLSNPIHYATTAIHDNNGIEYEISYENRTRGFVLIDTEGWDTDSGYDVEAEVIFGIFANQPYFINAVELSNLQRMDYDPNPIKNPDEIVQSWVLIDEYKYACMKGGDNTYANMCEPPLLYNVTDISRKGRKPWHVGSASFSEMFPEHILLGAKVGSGIIFSLPEGIFRFDGSLGTKGDQIAGEFIIRVDEPQKAIVFTVNPVNEKLFFYDSEEFSTVAGYKDLMKDICEKYDLKHPNETLDAHDWKTKRYAYVITLTDQWYDEDTNLVSDEIWDLADHGLEDFYFYQERISDKMKATTPLSCQ